MNLIIDNIIFSLQKSGGASVVWYQLLNRLIKEKEFNYKVLEYDNSNQNIFRKMLNIPIDNISLYNSKLLYLKRYINLINLQKEKYIFHSSHYRTSTDANAINITTVHDFTYEYFVKGLRTRVHSIQKNSAISQSKAIICVSQSTKNDLLNFLPKTNEKKVRVIYNGVDECFRVLPKEDILVELPFPENEYILYVGDRKSPYKNFSVVVDVCNKMKMPLLIIGAELSFEESSYLKEKLGFNSYFCLSMVDAEILNYVYNKAFCLLYPSLYEGFGIPIIEAQKAGCPVIAYNTSSIPEVMGDNEFALDTISADAICEAIMLLMNRSLVRENTVKQGLNNATRFSWDNTYKETVNLYQELYNS